MEARYPFVAVDVVEDDADEVSSELFDLGATGVEVRDDATLLKGPGNGRVTVVGSFDDKAAAEAAMTELAGRSPRLEEVIGDAWRDAWKEHFAPFALTPRITVVPPWVAYTRERDDELVLTLEPGRAFGTGLHASTSMVAELLHQHAAGIAGQTVLDIGTGSGILAFVALLYGAARAIAIDLDAEVIDVVRENAERNGLADRITTQAGTIEMVGGAFPFVLANIEARVLRPIAEDLTRVLAPGGHLFLAGVLASEHDAMVELYTHLGLKLEHVTTLRRGDAAGDGWVAIALQAPA